MSYSFSSLILRRIGCGLVYAAALVVAFRSSPAEAQHLAVVSRGADAVVFVDLATGEITDSVGVGEFSHELAFDSERRYAYTGSYRSNTVHAIDLKARTAREFVLEGYEKFHGVVVSRSGDLIWVTAEDSTAVLEVDASSGEIIRAWPTMGERSHMVEVAADARKLYVANMNSGTVTVINRETGETKIVPTAAGTEGIDVSPDGREVWIANRRGPTITILDPETDEVVGSIKTSGGSPSKLKFRPDGKEVWVSHHLGESVTVYDPATHTEIDSLIVGERPLALAFSQDGSRLYVSRTRADEIVEIDTATREILRRIPTADNPDGMVWLP